VAIRWGRIVAAAFLMEVALIAIAIPFGVSGRGDALVYVMPPVSLIVTFLVTVWLGRAFASRFVLQGALVGVVGSLMYVALTRGQPEPWQYLLGHALKVLGGAAGGWWIARARGSRQLVHVAGA